MAALNVKGVTSTKNKLAMRSRKLHSREEDNRAGLVASG